MSDQPRTSTGPLERAVLGPHPTIEHLSRASRPSRLPPEPRQAFEVVDAFMSVLSRHVAAVEDALLPVAHDRLPGGRGRVTDYVHATRALEQLVHALKARLYGDVQTHHVRTEGLWEEIETLLDDHMASERDLLEDLLPLLDEAERATLAEEVLAAGERAPTRPHPHTPHTGRIGRAAHRFWRVADVFWDTAEGRVVPHRRRAPHPKRGSLLTRYFTGVPRFEDPPRTDLPER